jgi:hypothetical protein
MPFAWLLLALAPFAADLDAAASAATADSAAVAAMCPAGAVLLAAPAGSTVCARSLAWDEGGKLLGVGTLHPRFGLELAGGDLGVTGNLAAPPSVAAGKIDLGLRSFAASPAPGEEDHRLALTGGATGPLGSSRDHVGRLMRFSLTGDTAFSTLLEIDHSNTGGIGASTGILVDTNVSRADRGAGIAVIDSGNADGIYVAVRGAAPPGATSPTGIGIDVNRSGEGGEANPASSAEGINCINWSQQTAGGCFAGTNRNGSNHNPVYLAQTNGYAFQAKAVAGAPDGPAFVVTDQGNTQFNWFASHTGTVSSYGQPRIVAWTSGPRNLPAGTFLPLAFDTLSSRAYHDGRPAEDVGGLITGNGSTLTASEEGLYLAAGGVAFAHDGTGSRLLQLVRNGSELVAQQLVPAVADATLPTALTLTATVYLAAGDTLQFRVWQTNARTAPLVMLAGRGNTWASLAKLF